jgi:hypothetical protein
MLAKAGRAEAVSLAWNNWSKLFFNNGSTEWTNPFQNENGQTLILNA